ncbi:MAG: HD domain-containing protein, partial [Oscillospiraceae bacterium]|nr:HD domain-containing protein [Oscillospiraceae bacterium]
MDQLKEKIIKSGRNYQLDRIEKAFLVADRCHGDQRRISGEPYIMHPVSVAEILIDLGMDTDSVVAALLHDVVEDTEYTLEELTREFSADVALLVDGVTKLGKIEFSSQEEEKAENIRKMLLAMSQDIRVMIIKLADRLHNQRTIWVRSDAKRREKSLETMEIFAPIAHRLGIRAVKDELEDISLHCLDPIAYAEIEEKLAL